MTDLRPSAPAALARKMRAASLAIAAERLWIALWPLAAVILAFVAVSLFGLWPLLPREAHQAALGLFGIAAVAALWPIVRWRAPTQAEAAARLEARSHTPHRPVVSYGDTLSGAAATPEAERLWRAHKERLAASFGSLSAGGPAPRVDRRDPFALRAALIIAAAVGLVAHGDEAKPRLAAAFAIPPSARVLATRLDAWITPPAYAAKSPIMLADGLRPGAAPAASPASVSTLENSELTARVNHPDASDFRARLIAPGAEPVELTREPASSADIADFRAKLAHSAAFEILDGERLVARWAIEVEDDRPPSIAITDQVKVSQRGALRIKYHVEDDYGVATARALLKQTDGAGRPRSTARRLGEPPTLALPLPRASLKSGDGQTYKDLTSHPWAGLPVVMTMLAEDQAGQVGGSDAGTFVLPERKFTKPLAKALIEQRKALVDRPDQPARAAAALETLTIEPESVFTKLGLYLNIRTVYWRLRTASDVSDIEAAVQHLWEIALKIEAGDLPEAERELREAQERLAKALDEGASEEEIERLVAELREALSKFLQAMAEDAARRAAEAGETPQGEQKPKDYVRPKEIDDMLKKIEDLSKTGSKDAARKLLSDLQDMLENLQSGQQQQQQAGGQSEMMGQLDQLSDLMARQQKLLEDTHEAKRQAEGAPSRGRPQRGENGRDGRPQRGGDRMGERGEGQPGEGAEPGEAGEGGSPLEQLRQRQQALREELKALREAMEGLSDRAKRQLDAAGEAMDDAGESLGRRDADGAAQNEAEAVDNLRAGAKAMAEQMMRSMQGQNGPGGGPNGEAPRDPLGRPNRSNGADTGDSVKVPDEIDIQRAREILDELRRRLGERFRPEMELDYLDRLIKRF
ncbi:MAG: TIGR02302 family protein [Hyphomicrobiales bacterium]|nr:TIGR02302 family protein [Hyphomicrobiales bacterium]